jgi:glycosyltransferase involved in cell wall biosynthesis
MSLNPGTLPTKPSITAAVCWPAPRLDRVNKALANTNLYEEMDGLSYLAQFGIKPIVIDSSRGWRNPWRNRGSLLAGIDPLRFLRQLWNYRHYDVLIAADSSAAFLFVCLKRLLRLKKPVLVIDPALDPNYTNRMRLHDLVLPYVQGVVVFGQVQVDFLAHRYGNQVTATFVRHRMDCRFFDPTKCAPPDPANPYIVSVGNDRGRDFDTLIEAVRGLPVRVVLHTRRTITGPLPDNVTVQSHWISFEELRALYGAAAIIAVPLFDTLHAGGTNGLLEALAMGRPIVVSASGGIVDYIDHQTNAWVVPPLDATAMRSAIEHLLANHAEANQLGVGAREYCEEMISMPVYAAQIAQLTRGMVTQR